jgi:hypothetical protein
MISLSALMTPMLCFGIDMAEAESEESSAIDKATPSNIKDFMNGLPNRSIAGANQRLNLLEVPIPEHGCRGRPWEGRFDLEEPSRFQRSVFVMPRYRGGRSSPENQPAASVLIGSTTTETLLLR